MESKGAVLYNVHSTLVVAKKEIHSYYIQSWTFAIIRLLNKPYENEVTLTTLKILVAS